MPSARDKVIKHLYGLRGYGNAYERPYGATIDGLAEVVGVSRGRMAMILVKLEHEGYVYYEKKHATGHGTGKTPRKCYNLTGRGMLMAKEMIEREAAE